MSKVLIIAEAGVNHNGCIETAKKLVEAAGIAGADYVKFQTFLAEELVSKVAKKADYQIENTGGNEESQFEMIEKLELTPQMHEELIAHCSKHNIKFLSTAFDHKSIKLLKNYNAILHIIFIDYCICNTIFNLSVVKLSNCISMLVVNWNYKMIISWLFCGCLMHFSLY